MEHTVFTLAELLAMPQFPGQRLLTPELPPEQVEPAYLRDNVALTLAEQLALRGDR